MPKLNYS